MLSKQHEKVIIVGNFNIDLIQIEERNTSLFWSVHHK